jgi:hypothetical protein
MGWATVFADKTLFGMKYLLLIIKINTRVRTPNLDDLPQSIHEFSLSYLM